MQLPPLFINQIEQLLGESSSRMLQAIGDSDPTVSVRVNTSRGVAVASGRTIVPWCDSAFYLDERPQFTFDPMWHAGMYYVQDASSMFINHVIKSLVHTPVRYLDLCAAPGGKTTAALQALPAGSLVVANEIVVSRARILADNVVRWGSPNSAVTCCAPARLGSLRHTFDVIATDVPCSGEGMFRKDEESVRQWSPALVAQCAERQRSILADVWPALRPGGLLIYSTCTYNTQENEQIIDYIVNELGAEAVAVPLAEGWPVHPGINTTQPCYRFLPHLTRGEGLFMAVLRKNNDEPLRPTRTAKQRTQARTDTPHSVKQWINAIDDYHIAVASDIVTAIPRKHIPIIELLAQCNLVQAGVTVGTIKGKNCVPAHSLALCTALKRESFAVCNLNYAQAIAYLRGEAIVVDAPRGHVAVAFNGAILGWANNLGNRANNMYPKPQRILSSHSPTTPPHVI